MNLQNWVEQARAHWKEFLPGMFKEFEDAGILERELQTAAKLTAKDMGAFQAAGLSWDEAWERTRNEYLFLPEEDEQKAKQDQEDEEYFNQQPFFQLLREINKLENDILQGKFDDPSNDENDEPSV